MEAMNLPALADILQHQVAKGGLWKVIPGLLAKKQPRPFFVLLGVVDRRNGQFATYEQGDFATTVSESPWLQSAEWCPVDLRGNETGAINQ